MPGWYTQQARLVYKAGQLGRGCHSRVYHALCCCVYLPTCDATEGLPNDPPPSPPPPPPPGPELTVEEWIVWMEEQKRQGMSEAQVAEYQRRKRLWAQREAEREEKRQREEEDQIRRTKERMDSEYK